MISGKLSGSVEKESSREETTETFSEQKMYGETTTTESYVLGAGDSVAVWQAVVNVFGHRLGLPHVAYQTVGESAPTEPQLNSMEFSYKLYE